jgi:selenide,water dikinase
MPDTPLTALARSAGCAAKIGQADLRAALAHLPDTADPRVLVGHGTSDDAAVIRLSDELALVETVDVFPPIVDDPYDYGRIAAANALSDIYAMGATPLSALSFVAWPVETLGTARLAPSPSRAAIRSSTRSRNSASSSPARCIPRASSPTPAHGRAMRWC